MSEPQETGSERDGLDDLLDGEVFETPADPFDRLVLNPGADAEESTNPLCPVCEEPIRPHANQHQRVFVCGCDETRRFEFGEGDGPEIRTDGGTDQTGSERFENRFGTCVWCQGFGHPTGSPCLDCSACGGDGCA